MLQRVRQTITKYKLLAAGDRVLVGVSGGADSTALLHILHQLAKEYGWELHVAHVEHGLRGEESLADAVFVQELAQKLGLPFQMAHPPVKRYSKEKGISIEMAARELRYEALEQMAHSAGCNKIALAHHADDQAETILQRVLRGTSISGLSGIPRKRNIGDIQIVRPFMEVYRDEIEEFCAANRFMYRNDSTNASPVFTRNRIRLQLLPLLQKEYNENVKRALIHLGKIAADENDWMEQQAKHLLSEALQSSGEAEIIIDVNQLLNAHIALQRRVITLILYYLCGDTNEWEGRHLDTVMQLAVNDNPSARVNLPNALVAYKEYHLLHIAKKSHLPESNVVPQPVLLNIPERAKAAAGRQDFKLLQFGYEGTMELLEGAVFPADEWEAVFDYAQLEGGSFLIRARREGDFIQPYGMRGTKKLKDLFIEAKVPRGNRNDWPIWTLQDRIVWVPGIRRSQAAAVSPGTRNTLRIRVTRYK